MELQDYPILYQASDSSAIHAEKKCFQLVRTRIGILIIIAGVTSFAWNQVPSVRTFAAIVLASFLIISMVISAIMDMKRFDRIWFSSRAIAESVKKESWSFMMKVEPYDGAVTDDTAEDRFLKRLDEVLHSQSSICPQLASHLQEGAQITEHMRNMRKKSLEDRRVYYTQNRIRDQKLWYTAKAKRNQTQESKWFIITWILQIAAAIIAIIIISIWDLIVNPVGILTTTGAGVLSWINARRYRELSQSYGLTAQELTILEAQMDRALTEEKLAEIVIGVETVISREHTIWLVRRLI